MATIHYSMSGEGRGHAARAQVLVELLRGRHRLILSASGQAYDMLEPIYRGTPIEVRPIPGLRFVYDRRGELHRAASLLGAAPFLAALWPRAAQAARQLERDRVDLVVSDFEPLLPRAADLAQIPSMSVDHQQFLLSYDLSSLPRGVRRKAEYLAPFSRPFYWKPRRSVISAFFFPPLKQRRHPTNQAGVLIRKDIEEAKSERGDHLVAYVRRRAPRRVLRALFECRRRVHIYGHGAQASEGRLRFFDVDPRRFAEDLATSTCLVSSAGNQVVGEALYLGKPVLAYPEPGNLEQQVNASFLAQSRCGRVSEAEGFCPRLIEEFVAEVPVLADHIRPERVNGNRTTLAAVEYEAQAATHATAVQTDPGFVPKLASRMARQL